jgi:hypothetical protein
MGVRWRIRSTYEFERTEAGMALRVANSRAAAFASVKAAWSLAARPCSLRR